MEKALSKRELVAVKGRATVARAKVLAPKGGGGGGGGGGMRSSGGGVGGSPGGAGALTRGQLDKAVVELEHSIKDTEKEVRGLCGALVGARLVKRAVRGRLAGGAGRGICCGVALVHTPHTHTHATRAHARAAGRH